MDKKIINIISNSDDFMNLKADLNSQIKGRCYCFVNEDAYLREMFLKTFVLSAFCESAQAPCLVCPKCKLCEADGNYDLCYFGEETGTVKKESIEKLLDSAITKPFEFDKKFLIIKNGDGLTEQCQNMLLKLIEELPAFDTIIILFSNTQKILPTIKSRSRNVLLHSLGKQAIVQIIGSSERSLNIIKCTDENMGKAIELDKSKDFDECFKFANQLLFNLENSSQIVHYLGQLQKNKDKLELYLYVAKGVFYMALKNEIDSVYSKYILAGIVKLISKLEIDLQKKQNKLMIIDELLLGIVKIKNEVVNGNN